MVRVPKNRVRFIHLHFNFCPCQTILFLHLVREPNSNIRSGLGQQNHFYPVRMRPVLFQNGGWRVQFPEDFLLKLFKKRRLPCRKTRTSERLDEVALFAFGEFALSRLL